MLTKRRRQTATTTCSTAAKYWITNGSTSSGVAIVCGQARTASSVGFLVDSGHARLLRPSRSRTSSRCVRPTLRELVLEDCQASRRIADPAGCRRHQGPAQLPDTRRATALRSAPSVRLMAAYDEANCATRRCASMFDKPIAKLPARAEQAGLDGQRDHEGPAPRVAPRPSQGERQAAPLARLAREAQQLLDGARVLPPGSRPSWVRTESPTSTRSCATCATSSRSSPTRARTTSTR